MTFKDAENKAVLRRLVREVKGLCPEFLAQHIHGTTQYKSLNIIFIDSVNDPVGTSICSSIYHAFL